MQHKGEIIEKRIRESGYSITKLAIKLGKSRRWMYLLFEKTTIPLDLILEIGKIIHHDFTDEIKELKTYKQKMVDQLLHEPPKRFDSDKEEAEYWKDKYLNALEKYNDLLLSAK
ncbi:MAG: putative transcriptional regulator [Crocinitomicaceae bacterium]|jgi:predicted transcriptional regulator